MVAPGAGSAVALLASPLWVLGKGWDYNGLERKGTVIRIFVNDDMESFPYEIETDEGIYLCVMEDMDHHIQHEEGSVIITDNDEIDEIGGVITDATLLRSVQKEIEIVGPA